MDVVGRGCFMGNAIMMRTWFLGFCCVMGLGVTFAVAEDKKNSDPYPQVELKTSQGDIIIELDNVRAPKSSENFLRYVNEGFYDGVVFHRVIKDYVIQAGRFDAEMNEKTGMHDPIPCEWQNGLKNERGTIGVARAATANSGRAIFYINVANSPMLDEPWPGQDNVGFAVFGRVVQGLEVVDAIARTQTVLEHEKFPGERWVVPEEPIVITKASVVPVSSGRAPEAVPAEGMKKIETVTKEEAGTATREEAAKGEAKPEGTAPPQPKKE